VDKFEVNPANFVPPVPGNALEILNALDASVKAAEEYLSDVDESAAQGNWRAMLNGKEIMSSHAP